jgi:septal ring factor EnvC (AmiA/AmiB activator)
MPAVAPIAAAPAPRRSRTWIPVVATAVCGIAVALVFLFLWLGSRSDAHSTSKKLAASQQSVRATTSSLKTAKQATTTANATVARERDALATANHQLADAEQSRSGLQNSIDAYKTCGADLSKFFQALESNNEPSAEAALIVAKLDCDRIDATIIPLTP